MQIKLSILTITHKHGIDTSAFTTREAADAALDAYCQNWWSDIPGNPPMPENAPERMELYFEGVESESADIQDAQVAVDSVVESLAQEALAYQQQVFEEDQDISGADLVEWFAEWRARLKAVLAPA